MLDFKKLKQSEIKKELIIDGEKVIIKNPTNKQRDEFAKILNGNVEYDKSNGDVLNLTMHSDDIDLYRQLFVDLIEGVENLPETKEEFAEVVQDPSDEMKLILDEFYEIIKNITFDSIQEQLKELDKKELELLTQKGINKVSNLINKYDIKTEIPAISVNGSEPIKVFENKVEEKEEIIPKPKRKYNKKKKVEDVVIESKTE